MLMNRTALGLTLVAFFALAAAAASASTPASTAADARTLNSDSPAQAALKFAPAAASDPSPSDPSHLFTVTDDKGVLLTCVAPELDTNVDTDLFKSCTLAPGRSLDDVMHTFIRGIHFVQNQQQKEREQWQKDLEQRTAPKPAQQK